MVSIPWLGTLNSPLSPSAPPMQFRHGGFFNLILDTKLSAQGMADLVAFPRTL
jgi:hypothetical protein